LTVDVKGKRILLVDDVADSGASLTVAKKYLRKLGASEIRIATLHYKPASAIKPGYFAETTEAWVNYPWEREETKKELKKIKNNST
jgi:hypothetical protein